VGSFLYGHYFKVAQGNKTIPNLFRHFLANIAKKIKGFSKDPFFYLGVFSITLLVIVSFWSRYSKDGAVLSLNAVSESPAAEFQNFVGPNYSQLQSPDLYLIQQNTILAFKLPSSANHQLLGTLSGGFDSSSQNDITEYEVKVGDTLSGIAEQFGISLNTVLWANNLTSISRIKAGQKLVIPPVSGVIYNVKAGDTISAIAKKYKANADEIVSFNQLSSQDDIFVGDILMIPDGVMPAAPKPAYVQDQIPIASSYFICPISSPCRMTQGLHFYNAVDFSHGRCGDYIYAAAGGTVQRIRLGWNGGAGNTIFILHPNGVVTSYGHIAATLVSEGDQVSQGQPIAVMGGIPGLSGSGISTGCHVHFAVHGGVNPFGR